MQRLVEDRSATIHILDRCLTAGTEPVQAMAFNALVDLAMVFSKDFEGGAAARIDRCPRCADKTLKYRFSAPLQERIFGYVQASLAHAARSPAGADLAEARALAGHYCALLAVNVFDTKYLAKILATHYAASRLPHCCRAESRRTSTCTTASRRRSAVSARQTWRPAAVSCSRR